MLLSEDLQVRRKRVREAMLHVGADACLLSVDVNLYYLTGRIFSGYFYISADGETCSFVKRPAEWSGEGVVSIRKPEQISEFFESEGRSLPEKILLEADEINYNEYLRLQAVFRSSETGNASGLMREVREIKTPWEISQLRISSQLHSKAYEKVTSCFRPGMTDLEFQAEIEKNMRVLGSVGIVYVYGANMHLFMGSVLAGANAEAPSPFDFALGGGGRDAIFPIGANGTALKEGMAVMVDMAGNFTAYMTDMTRVFSIGKLPELAYRAHQVALDIQDGMMRTAHPGVPCAELYNRAFAKVEKEGLADYFMGTKQQSKFVGHGIGLHLNEQPVLTARSKEHLRPGMTFAFEPKFVIPEVGAVGIENTFLVTETGVEKITDFDEQIIPMY
ncbi:MAG: Xaa-Pro peptidase family protein [Tannerella sp.]|jgi:Xaa-Pro aminopeptidase|nr:Xaa-Pro peptidase family protein [Tannerella sp.]